MKPKVSIINDASTEVEVNVVARVNISELQSRTEEVKWEDIRTLEVRVQEMDD